MTDTKYRAVRLDPRREGKVRALNWVQKKAAKFANNTNESCWVTLAKRRLIAQICVFFPTPEDGLGMR